MEWIVAPSNEKVSVRYANAMKAQESMQPDEAALLGDTSDPGSALCVLIILRRRYPRMHLSSMLAAGWAGR